MSELSDNATAPVADGSKLLAMADLQQRLRDFESYLIAEELTPSARFTYVDQASRYLRWLKGDYRPRNASASLDDSRSRRHTWTLAELRMDLVGYRTELQAARMKPSAVKTYTERSETFVRWLEGRYTSRGPNGLPLPVQDDDSWLDEANIQRHVVAWLKAEGWTIVRQADGREHGTDIDAERGDSRLAIEVKGHPRRIHTFGANKGQERKWHPGAQARTYYGNAVHTAITMLHADPDRSVAIALPDVAVYRGLVDRSRDPLHQLQIEVWFVNEDGQVRHG